MKVMLCSSETPDNARIIFNDSWVCEEKYDGVRAYITQGNIFSRSGRIITDKFPEFDISVFPLGDVVDGEIVCNDDFSMTSRRVLTKNPVKIRMMSKHMPSRFVAFDYLSTSNLSDVYTQRRTLLTDNVRDVKWIDLSNVGEFDAMWADVIENAKEGVIMKRKDSTYDFGKRSPSWVKVKAFLETEAIFTKLDVHTHGVRLETPCGKSVNVNGAKAKEVKAKFDVDKYVKCEVQYMPSPDANSDAWRFPSFRGLVK
jgi:DNA ligase-1